MLNNKDFFPTPIEVIETMIASAGINLQNKKVLEPSAGKGDIIDYCKANGATVYACEIDKDLKEIVKKKCDKFLCDDFLKLSSEDVSDIDYIIMNPPFSADEKHILHAYNIAPPNSVIVTLLNANTHYNTYSLERGRLKTIINSYGFYEDLDEAFENAERSTKVKIGLAVIYLPISEDTFGDLYFDMNEEVETEQVAGIMPHNKITAIVSAYMSAIKIGTQQIKLGYELSQVLKHFDISTDYTFKITDSNDQNVSLERMKIDLQHKFWEVLFREFKMEKYLTSGLNKTMRNFVEKQSKVPFTAKNIFKVIDMIIATHNQRMEQSLVEIFDKITSHHHDNRFCLSGYKTNSHYYLKSKFILEYAVTSCKIFGTIGVGHNAVLLNDLIKVVGWLLSDNSHSDFHFGYNFLNNKTTQTWYDVPYFEIKVFKKGTAHIKFQDPTLCYKINREVARIKGYPLHEAKAI